MSFANRVNYLVPEGAYAVLARALALEAEGHEIIHLEIGQPDFQTFPHICLKGIEAITTGQTRYNPPAGLMDLRKVIANDFSTRRGINVNPKQVVVGPGAKPGLFFTTLALIQPGDEVIYPDPGFPTYEAMIRVSGGTPVAVPLLEDKNFSFDLEIFNQSLSDRTRLILINSPSNPTGRVIPQIDLEYIAKAAQKYDCWVISDEIYSRLVYDGIKVPSISEVPGMSERTIIVDGFSKTYAMTGWRLGYAIMPEQLADRVELLLTHSVGCTATFTQIAGIIALTSSQEMVDAVVEEYQHRRDYIVNGLNVIPKISCQVPQGAFYVFPNIKSTGVPSSQLAQQLLEKAGVVVLPGTDFGQHGEGYLRLCYATSIENINHALERIERYISNLDII
jgi:aspartate/methionine/tyrosine aminotransferase